MKQLTARPRPTCAGDHPTETDLRQPEQSGELAVPTMLHPDGEHVVCHVRKCRHDVQKNAGEVNTTSSRVLHRGCEASDQKRTRSPPPVWKPPTFTSTGPSARTSTSETWMVPREKRATPPTPK